MTLEEPKWLQNGTYAARMDRGILSTLWWEGVPSLLDFRVTQRALGTNMSVDVAPGEAWVQGDDETDQGVYLCRSTAVENVLIDANSSGSTRIDLIVCQVNDPTAGGLSGDNFAPEVIKGTPGAGPPLQTGSSLLLATLTIVSGTTVITNAMITDNRVLSGRRDPAGTLMQVAHTGVTINGWLPCNGSAVNRITYRRLFATIGTTYGVGDGSTTFNLPDLRGQLPWSAGLTGPSTVNSTGGRFDLALMAHTHTVNGHAHTVDSHTHSINHGHTASTNTTGAHTHTFDVRSTSVAPTSGFDAIPTVAPTTTYTTNSAGSHSHTVTVASHTGASGAASPLTSITGLTTNSTGSVTPTTNTDNMPPFRVVGGYYIAIG
jgi:microcystin-dependent protein